MGDIIYVDFMRNNDVIDPDSIQRPPTLPPEPEAKPSPNKRVKSQPKTKVKPKGSKTAPPQYSLYHRIKCAIISRIEAYMA